MGLVLIVFSFAGFDMLGFLVIVIMFWFFGQYEAIFKSFVLFFSCMLFTYFINCCVVICRLGLLLE